MMIIRLLPWVGFSLLGLYEFLIDSFAATNGGGGGGGRFPGVFLILKEENK